MNRWMLLAVLLTGCGRNDNSLSEICTSIANPDKLLVDYHFQNQITGSTMTITESGAVVHTEHDCCPPTTTPITTADVDPATLANLQSARTTIKGGELVETTGELTSEGSKSGELYVFDGNIRCIAKIQARGDDSGSGHDTIRSASTTAAVETVRGIVNGYVSEKLP